MSTKAEQQRIKIGNSPVQRTGRPEAAFGFSRFEILTPCQSGLRDTLYRVIERLSRPDHIVTPAASISQQNVKVEVLGVRHGVPDDAVEPDIPENEKLKALQRECQSDMTILFVHGGGIYFGSPQEYRACTTKLARLTKARIVSTSYRLSPQSTFPAAILDVLLVYVSLLYPPKGAQYHAVSAEKIVFAGSSSGAMLLFAVMKFLIELRKEPKAIEFHEMTLNHIPLPAGMTAVSGWCDLCDCLPSWHIKGDYDILGVLQPLCMPQYHTERAWPADPPREHPYCRAVTLDYQLVCPAAVQDWSGSPPTWFAMGSEERGLDGNKVTASQLSKSGVEVEWHEFEGMTHEFLTLTGKLPQAKVAFDLWAKACLSFVAGRSENKATRWLMPIPTPVELGPPVDLAPFPHSVVRKRMREYNDIRPMQIKSLHTPKM